MPHGMNVLLNRLQQEIKAVVEAMLFLYSCRITSFV